ncbi:hypothetical protein [Methylococcus mesophilus]|uniref:hypothetical protein n=1 Tax=Methylococcus mesophilus TaxID=2993564 RepID=UPI00224AA282|nr:hypothetical protein [Methylococcus mesophilus]UZR30206.1 hypothetical protein OOT43_06070 [Methylococcus mesophilus]
MNNETKLELIKTAAKLTGALIQERNGHTERLIVKSSLPDDASVIDIFDCIYAHLSHKAAEA